MLDAVNDPVVRQAVHRAAAAKTDLFSASHKAREIYDSGVEAYKSKEYAKSSDLLSAAYNLMLVENNGKETQSTAICLSTLASCYRDLGELEMALACCE